MTVKLTGPGNCAECGTGITDLMAMEGDIGHFTFTIQGVTVQVPGLYVCTNCAGAIMAGELESGVTYGAAAGFLTDSFIPAIERYMEVHDGDVEAGVETAHARLHEAMRCAEILAMSSLLEAMEKAAEAEGVDREDMMIVVVTEAPAHPRDMASMN